MSLSVAPVRLLEITNPPSVQRVDPVQPGEAGEIGVAGHKGNAVVNSEGSELGVGDEGPLHLVGLQESPQNLAVLGRRLRDPCAGCVEPVLDLVPGVVRGERIGEGAGVGGDAKEGGERLPGQPYPRVAVQGALNLPVGDVVMRVVGVSGVEEDVGVDDHPRWVSPSRTSRTAPMSSRGMRGAPSEDTCWLKAPLSWCGRARPWRARALTAALVPRPRSRRSCSTATAMSSSRVTVVLTN